MRYRKLSDLQKDIETLALDSNNPARLRQELDAPVRSEGKWELSPEHELTYKERETGNGKREKEVGFKGSLVAAEPDALVVSVTVQEDVPDPNDPSTASARAGRSRPIRKRTVTGLVKLAGKWELDEKNRITFSIKRGLGKYDKLTFQGAWEINDNFQVTYTFETRQAMEGPRHTSSADRAGKRRRRVRKVTQELVFEGHWDISGKNCLIYQLSADSESAFRIKGAFQTRSILAKKGEIRYQTGIEYKTSRGTKKRLKRTIALFGKWKLSDDLALSFELECADGRRSEIKVGADFNLRETGNGKRGTMVLPDGISVDLTSSYGKPLGIEVVLTKDLFQKNAQAFVRLHKAFRETALEAGVTIPW